MNLGNLRLIDQKDLRELIQYSPQHIHRLEKAGKFPKRVRLGANRVGWLASEIEEWIEEKILERGAA